jgi:hypothetical protein
VLYRHDADGNRLDQTDGDPAERLPQRAGITWYAFAPDPGCDTRPVPVLAVPGGARRLPPNE